MHTDVDTDLVSAARAGDPAALDELVALHLPLVYNIVGRALDRGFGDVDDVVQETMLNVVRGLPELRAPEAFRSWLVAVAMNQVRRHYSRRPGPTETMDALEELADPAADFADLTIWELALTGQRREVARATAWLDPDDRDLLALWWLVEMGELSRPELVAGLGIDGHHAAVRVARMKNTLEIARCVVRALNTVPMCPGMADIAAMWHGRPEPLWRKRFARHVRDCEYCAGTSYDLIPAERLLARLALVPLPIGLAARVRGALRPRNAGPTSHRRISHGRGSGAAKASRVPARLTAAMGTAAFVGTAAVLITGGTGTTPTHSTGAGGQVGLAPNGAPSASALSSSASSSASASATAGATVDSSSPASATHTSATTKPTTAATTTKPKATATKGGTGGSGVTSGTAEQQVLQVINQARAQAGLPPLTLTSGLNKSAAAHTQVMMSGCGLSHQCPGEAGLGDRETAAGVHWSSAGENIGEGGPVSNTDAAIASMAVGLTNSMLAEKPPNDGHRKNILSSSFTHIGISVVRDSNGTVWMTQDFSN
jgi:RNA polymerase sigma factor (sigma-70 family)